MIFQSGPLMMCVPCTVQVSERVSEVVTSGGKEDQEESVGKKTPNYDNNEGGRRGECRLQSSRTLCKGRET